MKKKRGLSALAAEFGISRQAVSKQAKRGMPTHDADAAREWRRRELNPAKAAPDPGPSPATLVERLRRLVELAEAARIAGHVELVVPALRVALQAIPAPQRAQVCMPTWLWKELIGAHAMAVLDEGPRAVDMQDDEADEVGAVVFLLAAGEATIT